MKVEQLYTGCLSAMAYFISSDQEAVIIDPLRETAPYIEKALKENVKITYIFLTHFHADFVSGQVDLAKKTGATIVFGPNANPSYGFHSGKDGEEFKVGNCKFRLIHTPGHTLESSCYLLFDEQGKEQAIFTGDTLFIGDVGRPDLAVKSDLKEADLAGLLFDSLRNKIMVLPEDITVYPNHGAGSACGKNMSTETFDSLKNQKKTNYALQSSLSKQDFIDVVLDGLTPPPQYFPNNVKMNQKENTSLDIILEKGTKALSVSQFKELASQKDVLVLDCRTKKAYTEQGTVFGAWFIGLEGSFAPWVGALIKDINQKIIFLVEQGKEEEVVTRLSRVGYDHTLGYLKGGLQAWKAAGGAISKIKTISAIDFEKLYQSDMKPTINPIDVRKINEFEAEHVEGIQHLALDDLLKNIHTLDQDKSYALHCASGYRSLIASSILQANGISNITDIQGGFKALKETPIKMTAFVCPSKK